MIELYTWATPNGHKVEIALEELGLAYETRPVDIGKGEQFTPEFLKISPNNKIPAIVDRDGPDHQPISVFESAAILMYLGDKAQRLYPTSPRERIAVHEWLFFQMGSVGPMFGQANHFSRYSPEKIPYAIDRYLNESLRLAHVMDRRLGESAFIAGSEYTIADIALYPWVRSRRKAQPMEGVPNLDRWLAQIGARPAVERVLGNKPETSAPLDDKSRDILFGKTQYTKR